MIRVTIERPSIALAAHWEKVAPFASNAFMHPVALQAASDTLSAAITVLLAWDTSEEPNRLVGWWALQRRRLLLWSYLEAQPFSYAFLSTPVLAPGTADDVMPAFLSAIARGNGLPATLRLRDFDGAGPHASALDAAALPHTLLVTDLRPTATREDGLKRSGSTRKKLRQDWNRLAATGELEAINVRAPDAIGAAIEAFLELEASGWKGDRGTALLNDAADAAFARRFIADMAAAGLASIALLRLDGRPVAAQVLIYSGRTAYTWKTSYDPGLAKYSPGMLLVDRICTELLDSGEIDMLNSCAVADGFMGRLLSGRKPMLDMIVSTRSGWSPSYLAVAGYFRLREWAKQMRNRTLVARPAPAQPTPLAAGPFAELAMPEPSAQRSRADRSA